MMDPRTTNKSTAAHTIEADDNYCDTDDCWEDQYENGRRYTKFPDGRHILPNDKQEQDRMDLVSSNLGNQIHPSLNVHSYARHVTFPQEHHIYREVLNGRLYCSPLKGSPQRTLDLGTGTGAWAIDFADQHPTSQVIGIDLSPIQHPWAPPNCIFEIDDVEAEWPHHKSRMFDFIHSRDMAGSIHDYDRLFTQAYKHLRRGGYLEMQSFEADFFSDDGTRARAKTAIKWQQLLVTASEKFGKSVKVEDKWKGRMVKAGFVDLVEEVYKVPMSPWPKEPKLKALGRCQAAHMCEVLESYSMALFTRVLGWTKEELDVLLMGVRNDLMDPLAHLYGKVRIIYGRKGS